MTSVRSNTTESIKIFLFFETCIDLQIVPKFFKFKPPKLKVYRNARDLNQIIVNKQLKLVKNEQRKAKKEFESDKKEIFQKLSF